MLFSLSVNGNNREVKCYLESDNWIVQNLNNALETWNSKLSEIWQLLTQSPETFKGGDIWSVMLTIHDALKGIGYGLLVLFFAISVVKTCSSYLDVKKPEHAVKLFIRFALAKGAVGYGLELMMALFSVIQGMVSTIMQNSGFGGDSDVIELPAEMVEKIESVGLLDNGFVNAMSQNVDEVLRSDTARLMLANSEFLVMLNQASTDREELARLLNISDNQLGYITNVKAGSGLIRCSGNLVPFENTFPRNTKLYQLMTTKPGESLKAV